MKKLAVYFTIFIIGGLLMNCSNPSAVVVCDGNTEHALCEMFQR